MTDPSTDPIEATDRGVPDSRLTDPRSNDLAIVIPAYKPDFLHDSLASISAQTERRFTVYIGDDASPHDLASIVAPFHDSIDLRYHRFESNLGGEDVVAQWERCIALTRGEPWIWVFSDDDLMDPGCVEAFHKALLEDQSEGCADLYRFNTIIIDGEGGSLGHLAIQPRCQTSQDFLRRKLLYRTEVYLVDGIFSARAFRETGGFVRFPRAWGSDDATWIRLGYAAGMRGIPGPMVRWRLSGVNISGQVVNPVDRRLKRDASLQYMDWLRGERAAGRLQFSEISLWVWYIVMLKVIGYWRIPFRGRRSRRPAQT